ncbi:39S ribosomal protein L45 [Comamonas sp. Y33R10-2]|uniref:Tim44 domain-containing protein n=1 Tax=Comamonas sp. Y33R10-2 TaxID=2853257 RepID=UPI001C5C8C2F|nr:Tim44-like domain-containing protein [Comamonas sp. Y33R10-2]QXZ09931.1 39S ribosomal protein L45 [Comamonas sp. Y33R10-2]
MKKLWSIALVAMLVVAHGEADAKRMGGGSSMGKQSGNVTQREASRAPAQNTQQAQQQNAAQPNRAATPATPAAAPKKPWGAMLGGLAAGLGLAWLANSLGMGEAFGNMLMFGLLAMAIMVVVGMIMRRRKGAPAAQVNNSPFAFQGAGNLGGNVDAPQARQYNPEKIGNDASARPWEQDHLPQAAAGGSMIGSAVAGSQNWDVPEGFDQAGFLTAAKRNFVTLQAAWDRSDINSLRSMMTDEMLSEIRSQLSEREAQRPGEPNHTDVMMIEAQLLGVEDLGNGYMASVEFSGMIREDASAGPSPFREVWNMTKPKSGSSGWLVAGVQALQ